jgi:hypothetical protein
VSSHDVGACPGCGLRLEASAGPVHPYIGASPACWALYGRVLDRAYSDAACRDVLQVVVDTYACQHPGEPGRRSAQSVGIHLMTLCMVLEDGADPREGPKLHRRMVARPAFTWLEPPPERGRVTVAALLDAPSAAAYVDAVWAWARESWRAWQPHHDTVRAWIAPSLS